MLRAQLAVCLLALTCAALGQDVATAPAFEVASIKPSDEKDRVIGMFTYPGGRVTTTNYTLKMLIHEAYDIEDYRITGGPAWLETDRYNLEARPPASSPSSKWVPENFKTPPNAEMRRMLQSLLAERFQLQLHRELRKGFTYGLVVAKGGPRLATPKDATQQPLVSFLQHGLRGQNATMNLLVERLGQVARRPVVDRTGLKGSFDFLIDYPPDDAGTDIEARLISALQQVGMKFETQSGSIEMIVIDHAEKPSAN